jgi:nicotinamidase-related amidase
MNRMLLHTRRDAIRSGAGSLAAIGMFSGWGRLAMAAADEGRTIPAVPGMLELNLRRREPADESDRVLLKTVRWEASATAIIICDMWADHPCKMAAMRVNRMAPRMNEVVSLARDQGVAVIHAPSSGVKHYEETPFRKRMKEARPAMPPVPIQSWCHLNEEREGPWPIVDDVKRGEAIVTGCDDPEAVPHHETDRRQHPAIQMIGYDGVSDKGQEIFNFLEQEKRSNIVLMGVHTNMCVLGRPFGIRQQRYLGKNVVLCRDLTDALYDPRDPPHVSHARGLELVIEHIEKFWCPSMLGQDLTQAVAGSAGPLAP